MRTHVCQACRSPIIWAKLPSGKTTKLNAIPTRQYAIVEEVGEDLAHAFSLNESFGYSSHVCTKTAASVIKDQLHESQA